MTRVILDASALTAPVQTGVRLFEELDRVVGDPEPVVPRAVVTELDGLRNDGGEAGTAASVGRDLVERCRVAETRATYGDDAVVELADRLGGESLAATADAGLRDRLLARDVRVIGIRNGNTVAVSEP